jgi:hypothetical protein
METLGKTGQQLTPDRMTWFKKWIVEDCEPTGMTSAAELLAAWRVWAKREVRGGSFFMWSARSLGMALRQLGYRKEHTMKGTVYFGIRPLDGTAGELQQQKPKHHENEHI